MWKKKGQSEGVKSQSIRSHEAQEVAFQILLHLLLLLFLFFSSSSSASPSSSSFASSQTSSPLPGVETCQLDSFPFFPPSSCGRQTASRQRQPSEPNGFRSRCRSPQPPKTRRMRRLMPPLKCKRLTKSHRRVVVSLLVLGSVCGLMWHCQLQR